MDIGVSPLRSDNNDNKITMPAWDHGSSGLPSSSLVILLSLLSGGGLLSGWRYLPRAVLISAEHTSVLQSQSHTVWRLMLVEAAISFGAIGSPQSLRAARIEPR